MLIFIDESGDAGFQIGKGSSETFTVAMVIFDDELDAEEASLCLKRLKRKLNKSEEFEFKFNKSSKELRIQILNELKGLNFRIRAIVFRKQKIYSLNLRSSKEKFYNYAVKCLLENNSGTIENAKIRIDASSDKNFKKELSVYLRKTLNNKNSKIMKNFKFRDSHNDILIQLADMVAGSINRKYNSSKEDKEIYLKIIKRRVEDIWEFN